MPDSSEIDAAISAKLLADATLMALVPDGVYFDVAKKSANRFVIISLLSGLDEPMLGGRAYEAPLYLVKAVDHSTSGLNVKAAAARIDVLLDHQPLTITGYGLMMMRREERIRITEGDPNDEDNRWQHRGGHYAVTASAL